MAFPYLQDAVLYYFGLALPLPIPTFGLMVLAGMFTGLAVFRHDLTRTEPRLRPLIQDFAFTVIMSGVLGARLFHILEYPAEFLADPMGMIFSRGGFTIIGGLIAGTVAGVWFVRKRGFAVLPAADSAAPAMMLGYGVGRLGCQFSGDGDWGIAANMSLKPGWLPDWLWAQQYHGNIAEQLIPAPGVYPTPLYEVVACLLLFFVLWVVRRHRYAPGWLFAVYMLLSGVERWLIEQIRVNSRYHLFGLSFTQAEAFSICFIVVGLYGMYYFAKSKLVKSL